MNLKTASLVSDCLLFAAGFMTGVCTTVAFIWAAMDPIV